MNKRNLIFAVFIAALIVLVVVFILANNSALRNGQGSQNSSDTNTTDPKSVSSENEFVIEMEDMKYSLTEIKAKPGDTLRIRLSSKGDIHNFVIDELNIKSNDLEDGRRELIVFDIPEDASGKTFEYYCSIENHKDLGMVGQIVVE